MLALMILRYITISQCQLRCMTLARIRKGAIVRTIRSKHTHTYTQLFTMSFKQKYFIFITKDNRSNVSAEITFLKTRIAAIFMDQGAR